MKEIKFLGTHVRTALVAALAVMSLSASAQYVRTTYFMANSPYRMQLNPAMAPDRGYFNLPVLGQMNASMHSNSLGLDDVIDIVENHDDADYFASDHFMSKLDDVNKATLDAGTDIVSAGWWHGDKTFLSINVSVKANGNTRIPREYFQFLRDMKGLESNDYSNYVRDIRNEQLNINVFSEVGFSYTRRIGDRVSLGGRVKALLGLGNVKVNVRDAVIKTNVEGLDPDFNWSNPDPSELILAQGTASLDVDADMECSFQGLDLLTNERGYIDDMKYETKNMGISGYGAAIDAGIAVEVADGLTLSAAINDLGFIQWTKKSTTIAHSAANKLVFSSDNPSEIVDFTGSVSSAAALNYDLFRFTIDPEAKKSRKTSLSSTMVVGGDYSMVNDKLRLGVLYTTRFTRPENENELTFSVNYSANSLLDFAVSYSPMMCGGKSFGVGLRLGPLFVGSDYMYLGKNHKCCNALVGLTVPLGSERE